MDELNEVFGEEIGRGVLALTKNDELESKREKMLDSLGCINREQKEVAIVKLADRITNLQPPPNHWDVDKINTYLEEERIIASMLKNKNSYLNTRLMAKIKDCERFAAASL